MKRTAENMLIKTDHIDPVALYTKGGMDDVLKMIEEATKGIVFDISTPKGEKECSSFAYKLTRSKTFLDGIGKDLKSDAQKTVKQIDSERKRMRDFIDGKIKEVKAPLLARQKAEDERVARIEEKIQILKAVNAKAYSYEDAKNTLAKLNRTALKPEHFEERLAEAYELLETAKKNIQEIINGYELAEERRQKDIEAEKAAAVAKERERAELIIARERAKVAEAEAAKERAIEIERAKAKQAMHKEAARAKAKIKEQQERKERIAVADATKAAVVKAFSEHGISQGAKIYNLIFRKQIPYLSIVQRGQE